MGRQVRIQAHVQLWLRWSIPLLSHPFLADKWSPGYCINFITAQEAQLRVLRG
jgi:hypothetical protein